MSGKNNQTYGVQRKNNRSKPPVSHHQDSEIPVLMRLSKSLAEHLQKVSAETCLPREAVASEAIHRGLGILKSAR